MCRSSASGDGVPHWGGLIRDALVAQPVLCHAPWARPRGARVSRAPPAQQSSTWVTQPDAMLLLLLSRLDGSCARLNAGLKALWACQCTHCCPWQFAAGVRS